MTITNFDLSPTAIRTLFEDGKCLTFVPFMETKAWVYAKDKQREFEKQTGKRAVIKSKTAIIPQESFTKSFHFFSNGVLIVATLSEKKIKNIKRVIELHGYEIKEIYRPRNAMECIYYDIFLNDISQQAQISYDYQDDVIIEPLPDIKTFVEDLFAGGNECLTASKNEMFDPKFRDYLALFANGRIILSEEKTDSNNIFGTIDHYNFRYDNSDYVFLKYEYVPQSYIDAIYQKAKDYNWYMSAEETLNKIPLQHISEKEKNKMNAYIDDLLKNRTCISITIPVDGGEIAVSPDKEKYVLFSDGKLVYAKQNSPKTFLKRSFPDLNFEEEQVPEYCIEQIYKRLLTLQKSANTIFVEMLKQKAKKLKKLVDIPHHQALDVVAKMAGVSGWEKVTELTEQQSRRGIYIEQYRKKLHKEENPQEILEKEYKRFLSRK